MVFQIQQRNVFLVKVKMFMSIASFFKQLDCGINCLQYAFR